MRRLALLALVLVAAAAIAAVASASGGPGGDPYMVRAIFDDASFAVKGEQVRVAGAPVGSIASGEISSSNDPTPRMTLSRSAACCTTTSARIRSAASGPS